MNINSILNKPFKVLTEKDAAVITDTLKGRLYIEYQKKDRGGIYAQTQKLMAYNSNKIEGSTLTPEQTASLFETGTIFSTGNIVFRAKDIEEMTGHFSMFNEMLKTLKLPLNETIIKSFHFHLKSGVFEDIANGYPVGEYKNRVNMVSDIKTSLPNEVPIYMKRLINDYNSKENHAILDLAKFHAEYENIHPFQDGNGRTGRMILFRESLKNNIIPIIITDDIKSKYYHALHTAQKDKDYNELVDYFKQEQEKYYTTIKEFLYEYIPNIENPIDSAILESKQILDAESNICKNNIQHENEPSNDNHTIGE